VEVDIYTVIKNKTGHYRYRADGEDYGAAYLATVEKFKFRYHKSMELEDIMTVETLWFEKLSNKEMYEYAQTGR
jgi:hypothetical protein